MHPKEIQHHEIRTNRSYCDTRKTLRKARDRSQCLSRNVRGERLGDSRRGGLPFKQYGNVRFGGACPWEVSPCHRKIHSNRSRMERGAAPYHRLLYWRAIDSHQRTNPAVKKAPRRVLSLWLIQYPKIVSFKIFIAIIAIGRAGIAATMIAIGAARLPSAFLRRNQAAKGVTARKVNPMMIGHANFS